MSSRNELIDQLASLVTTGQPCVVVTLIDAVGSTPQDAGSKMLVTAEGLLAGTVGGGRIEQKAIGQATSLLVQQVPRTKFVQWNLQTDVGMTCGGVVRLFFEVYNRPTWRVVIFGAGHVSQALVRALLPLDCQVWCIDSRADWLDRLPSSPGLKIDRRDDPSEVVETLQDRDFVLCMTMGHRTDRPILERIFRLRRRFDYLGVIGSRAKRKVLIRELTEAGIDPAVAEQFECPIGLPIGNNQPYEIAISVIAQLLQRRDEADASSVQRAAGASREPEDSLDAPSDEATRGGLG